MDNKESNKWNGQQLALFVFEAAMSVFYLVFSVVCFFPVLFPPVLSLDSLSPGLRTALGIILGIYGIFRIYRVIRKLRSSPH